LTRDEILDLYCKEREYQKKIFGDYKNNPVFSVSSFLVFLNQYIQKAMNEYAERWDIIFPEWFVASQESEVQGTAPVGVYEALIKLHALSGAALETFVTIDVERWREKGIKEKWVQREGDNS